MQHKRPPIPVIVLILVLLGIGGYYGIRFLNDGSNGALKASGSIEATTVSISPELAGKVAAVLVEDGQFVQADEILFQQDDSLIQAERVAAETGVATARSTADTAQAAYESAQIQYEIAVTSARVADQNSRIVDWIGKRPDYFDQPNWYFTREEQTAAAQVEVQAAEAGLQDAQANLENVIKNLDNAQFLQAEKDLANTRIAYLVAKDASDRAQISEQSVSPDDLNLQCPPFAPCYRIKINAAKTISGQDDNLLDVAQDQYDVAKADLEDTQKAYDDLLSTDAAREVMDARALLTFAQERLELARDRLSGLQTGEDSLSVSAAAQAVEQAKTTTVQAKDVIEQATAQLALIDAQIEKLTIRAPKDGVILTRNVEPGEFVQPGATALTLADLSSLVITVYVPEDRYGQIYLGQQAQVTVDSFPGVTFQAEVTQIADQAEYTPRNVQTVEGRSSTVYAIKLKVTDSEGKLKIGMPADVIFLSNND